MKHFSVFIVSALCLFGIVSAQKILWPVFEENFYQAGEAEGYIPSGKEIRPMLFGFDHFAADLFWLRTVQYVGGNSRGEYDAIAKYIVLVTELDPHFVYAYHFAALLLPTNANSKGALPALLEKGIAENPKSTELIMDLAYYTFYYEEEYEKAAKLYERCISAYSDCPRLAKNMAANMRQRTGKYGLSLRLWQQKMVENGKEMSDEEWDLAKKKMEEGAKMAAIECAAKTVSNITSLTDLIGIEVTACSALDSLSEEFLRENELTVITPQTLTTPFPQNPFKWDAEKKAPRTQLW